MKPKGSPLAQKGRGRPPVQEPRSTVSTWLPASAHDRLIKVANAREMSVSAIVRHIIITGVPPER